MTAERIVTPLYVVATLFALKQGKIIKALISREPNILIPSTIVRAERIANRVVYLSALNDADQANTGSKVTTYSLGYKRI